MEKRSKVIEKTEREYLLKKYQKVIDKYLTNLYTKPRLKKNNEKLFTEETKMAKKKEEAVVPTFIDSVEALEAKMKAMREAQKVFATYTQEQVDKIFFEAAMAANKMRIPLAKMAVEETGRGLVEDKVIKNHYAAEYTYNAYKHTKTCGVFEETRPTASKRSLSLWDW